MRKVDKEDKSNEQKEDGTNKRNIVAPEGEEGVRDKKSNDDESNPGNQLGSPEAILNSRSLVTRVVHSDKKQGQDKMKEAQRKVDAVYGGESITLLARAGDCGIVQENLLQFLYSPVREHNPGQKRV